MSANSSTYFLGVRLSKLGNWHNWAWDLGRAALPGLSLFGSGALCLGDGTRWLVHGSPASTRSQTRLLLLGPVQLYSPPTTLVHSTTGRGRGGKRSR